MASLRPMGALRVTTASLLVAALCLGAAACGGSDDDGQDAPADSPLAEPAATEASPEAAPAGPETGSLPEDDRGRVERAVRAYIAALNAGDGDAVCAGLAPGAIGEVKLPAGGADCATSVRASIGYRGPGGTPAWKRTEIAELTAVSVGPNAARVTATVSHDFADRGQPSIEEDVIFLTRSGERWVVAKPSASFYRAVGYPEPPISAFTAP